MSATKALALAASMTIAAQAALANPAARQSGPLAPGNAASIAQAQDSRVDRLAVWGAAGLVAVGIFLIVGTRYHNPGNGNSAGHSASGTH